MKKLIILLVMLVFALMYIVPAEAQHVNECPVGSQDQVGIAPHDYCNDTTFHNDRQYSPGDTTQTINDISPITQDQYFSQDDFSSGNIDSQSDILNQGNNNIMCPSVQQLGSTGNNANQQGLETFNTNFDDAELTGNSIETSPAQSAECAPVLDQSSLIQ